MTQFANHTEFLQAISDGERTKPEFKYWSIPSFSNVLMNRVRGFNKISKLIDVVFIQSSEFEFYLRGNLGLLVSDMTIREKKSDPIFCARR